MKRFLFGFLILGLLPGCQRQRPLIIEGQLTGEGRQVLYLYRMDLTGDVLLDSMRTNRAGNFLFRYPGLAEPTFFKLALDSARFITLLADSAEHVTVRANVDNFHNDYVVENSGGSQKIQELNRVATRLQTSLDSLLNYFNRLTPLEQQAKMPGVTASIDSLVSRYKGDTRDFVMANPRSFASYYALFITLSDGTPLMDVMDPGDRVAFAALATSLNIFYPGSDRARHLYNMVLEVKVQERRARLFQELVESGANQLPDITAMDVSGNDVSLSSLDGNVVLLSFWASWDQTSRRENSVLARVYQRYRDQGFRIYQVGLERSRVLWELALRQDNVDWVSVTEFQYTNSHAATIYNVQQLPANYLISRDGEIIGRNLFGPRLEERLAEIFR